MDTVKIEIPKSLNSDLLAFISRLDFEDVDRKSLSLDEKHSFLIALEEFQDRLKASKRA